MMECPPNGFRSSKGDTRLALESSEKATSKLWGWGVAGPKRRGRQNSPLQSPAAVKTPEQQARGPLGAQVPGAAWPGEERPTVHPPSRTRGPGRGSGSGRRAAPGPSGCGTESPACRGLAAQPRRTHPGGTACGHRSRSALPLAPVTQASRGAPRASVGLRPGRGGLAWVRAFPKPPRRGPQRAPGPPEPSAPPTRAAFPCAGKRKRTN